MPTMPTGVRAQDALRAMAMKCQIPAHPGEVLLESLPYGVSLEVNGERIVLEHEQALVLEGAEARRLVAARHPRRAPRPGVASVSREGEKQIVLDVEEDTSSGRSPFIRHFRVVGEWMTHDEAVAQKDALEAALRKGGRS